MIRRRPIVSCAFFAAMLSAAFAPVLARDEPAAAPATGPQSLAGTKLGKALAGVAPEGWADAAAILIDAGGAPRGAAYLRVAPTGVLLRIGAQGLAPGWRGIHFHEVGDCSDGAAGFKKSGPHFDPDGHDHGLMQEDGAERGDLPNVFAPKKGLAVAEFFRHGVSLGGGGGLPALLDADGFAVVIHAASDDQKSQPIGGAGDRVLCAAFVK